MARGRKREFEGKTIPTDKAKRLVVQYIGQGMRVEDAMARVGRTAQTYKYWRKNDSQFALDADVARQGSSDVAEENRRAMPAFPEFSEKYLHQPLYNHQLQWVDLLEGREPRNLHPAQTYEPGDPQQLLINTPPEHAKSTTITVNYLTYRICGDPNVRILIVSKTKDMASKFLHAIKTRLTHPRYRDLQLAFAPGAGFKDDAAMWRQDKFYLGADARDSGEKDPTVEALGIGGQIYGARADIIVVDDAVVLDNANEYEKQIAWLQQEVLTRLGPTGLLLVVGTRVAAVDLYKELRNEERYPEGVSPWTYLTQPAVLEFHDDPDDWVTLWPKAQEPWPRSGDEPYADGLFPRWDGVRLKARRSKLQATTWARAYMQADVAEDNVFDPEAVRRAVNGRRRQGPLYAGALGHREKGMDGLYVIGGLDPAPPAGVAGLVILAVDRQSRMRYVLEVIEKRNPTPAWIKATVKEKALTYGLNEWRIERNAFQQYLTQDEELKAELAATGCALNEHWTGKNKLDPDYGVAGMAPLFVNGLIELPGTSNAEAVSTLIGQLVAWSPGLKIPQDLVMALWFAEIRARELVLQSMVATGGSFVPNRWLSRRDRDRQVVVNLADVTAARVG